MSSDLQNKPCPASVLAGESGLARRPRVLRQVESADLLGKHDSLTIRHQGESYILRQTRAGKLILTK